MLVPWYSVAYYTVPIHPYTKQRVPLCMPAYTSVPPTPLYDAGIIMGTLMYARIHMGIPLTLYDVCIHKGPSMISTEFTLGNIT